LLPPDDGFLRLKCTKFDYGWGSAPDPAGGAYSAPPDPLAGFGGRFAAGEGSGLGKRREGRELREGPKLLLNQGLSEPCYRYATDSVEEQTNTSRQKHTLLGVDIIMILLQSLSYIHKFTQGSEIMCILVQLVHRAAHLYQC